MCTLTQTLLKSIALLCAACPRVEVAAGTRGPVLGVLGQVFLEALAPVVSSVLKGCISHHYFMRNPFCSQSGFCFLYTDQNRPSQYFLKKGSNTQWSGSRALQANCGVWIQLQSSPATISTPPCYFALDKAPNLHGSSFLLCKMMMTMVSHRGSMMKKWGHMQSAYVSVLTHSNCS